MRIAFFNEENPVTGRTVLWWMFSFFGVIFIANFFFIYFALTSWTGLSTENAYEKGVRYNQTLARGQAQKNLGWQSSVVFDGQGPLKVTLVDKRGKALTGLSVHALLIRPVIEGSDQKIKLREVASGLYQAPVRFTHKGRWQVEVIVEDRYRLRHDLEVK